MVVTLTQGPKRGKKAKRKDDRPARKRYWAGRHLEKNKTRHMRKAYGLTKKEAEIRWNAERETRVPAGFLQDYTGGKANTHRKRDAT